MFCLQPKYRGTVLVTGATGFVGQAVALGLLRSGYDVLAVSRRVQQDCPRIVESSGNELKWHTIGPINRHTSWMAILRGVDTIIHCAARAHVMHEKSSATAHIYNEVNVDGTLALAEQAIANRVRRFVFLSSIGVNGCRSVMPFTEIDEPHPYDPYTNSKLKAEQALLKLSQQSGMEVVIVRPPLVYGPNAPGNFGNLVRWVQRGVPLPLGAVNNKRSFLAIDNLVSFLMLCADRNLSPHAANEVFVVADGEDVSTTSLLRMVAKSAGCPINLIPIPPLMLRLGLILVGKRSLSVRLLGNLQVNATKARMVLNWNPIVSMEDQMAVIFNGGIDTAKV
jgi:nucleoside-diphosphate-sugar epimerase